jgi:hypothetical protein
VAVTRAALLLAGLGSLLVCAPAAGQYLAAYKSGLEAIDAQQWEAAAKSMAEAILERREEKLKLPARLFMRPYIPHFYLGYARFKLGDCAGALTAWTESERQGVLPKLEEAAVARAGREQCAAAAERREIGQAREDARQLLSRTSVTAAALLDLARGQHARAVWSTGSPSPSSRHDQGLELMQQARELLADDDVDRAGVERAEGLIRDAGAIFEALRTDVERLVEERSDLMAQKDQGIDARVATAREVLARTTHLAPYPRLVRKARADLEGLMAEAQRRDGAAHLDGLAARLETSIKELERLTAAPPATLDRAVEDFLGGRHDQVIAALQGEEFGEARARAHARLLLAASRHALFLEGGELDADLRATAADDARASRRDDAGLTPTDRFFSPRFVAFFDESVAATPPG